jgi:hypothetical protein
VILVVVEELNDEVRFRFKKEKIQNSKIGRVAPFLLVGCEYIFIFETWLIINLKFQVYVCKISA